jgi:hypothetical protein
LRGSADAAVSFSGNLSASFCVEEASPSADAAFSLLSAGEELGLGSRKLNRLFDLMKVRIKSLELSFYFFFLCF